MNLRNEKRVEDALRWCIDFAKRNGCSYFKQWYFIRHDDKIFGMCPEGTAVERLFGILNTNDIFIFNWKGDIEPAN